MRDVDVIHVLYVTGEREFGDTVATALEREDSRISVHVATSPDEGLTALDGRDVDCVVSDHDPPRTDGVEFLETVRETYPELPFVLFPENGSESVASDAIAAGVTAYLQHGSGPEQYERLADRIANAVERSRAGRRPDGERQREQAERIFEQTQDALFLVDVSGGDTFRIQRVNRTYEELTGFSTTDVGGKTPREIVGDEQGAGVESRYRECVETGEILEYDEAIAIDGETRHWHTRLVPIVEDDTVVQLVGATRDVTDRREREREIEAYNRALRTVYDVISDTDRSTAEQVADLLAHGREVLDLEYGSLSQVQDGEYTFEVVEAPDDLFEAGDTVALSSLFCERTVTNEQTVVVADAAETDFAAYDEFTEWGVVSYIGAPVVVEGEVYGTLCFCGHEPRTDGFADWEVTLINLMSQWVGYELERHRRTERLAAQNERLDEFASMVSHDLRNPLNVAKSRLELARDECDSAHLDQIERAHDRMDDLIDDLLTVARETETVPDTEPVDIAAIVEECWANVETEESTLVVETDRTVEADRGRLKRVFENFVRNAVEHGDGTVTVTVGELADGFYVEDDGPGIPEAERGGVFDAGYSTSVDGTGYGLNIVEGIVDAHGWEIRVVESTKGGARFEITGVEFASE